MLSTALLTALLEAERALGRLAEACQDEGQRRRLWADAARREARAAARLDGIAIDGTDVLIATINPDLTGTADRPAALAAHALWQGARFAQGLRDRPNPHPRTRVARGPVGGPGGARTGTQGVAAEVWRAVALLERGEEGESLADHADDDDIDGVNGKERSHAIAGDAPPAPLTVRWIESAWRVLEADVSGRDPTDLRLTTEQEADAAALLERLDRAGQAPALLGAVGVLAELMRPVPDQRTPAWLRPTMRLLATRTVAHHCRLPGLWLPLSTGLWTDRTAAAIAARSGDEAWRLWLTDRVAETARRERQRLATLDQTAQSWRRRMGERRRNSRLPEVIDGLFDTPAFTVRHLQQRLGTTFRGAQLLVNDLVEAGVLRDVTNRALDRVFVAVELLP